MASKRQRKKIAKKRQQAYLKSQGYSTKNLTYNEINKQYKDIVTQQQKKEKAKKKYQKALDLQTKKFNMLVEKGFDPFHLKTSVLRHIKLKDIEQNNLGMEKYPELYPELDITTRQARFNYNKPYTLKNGKAFYFAYMDYTGENDFNDLIRYYDSLSNKELLRIIKRLLHTPPSYQKSKRKKGKKGKRGTAGTSSGRAGTYKLVCADPSTIQMFNRDNKRENTNLKKREYSRVFDGKRTHTKGNNVGYQVLSNGRYISHKKVTGHTILSITACIMENVTEWERFTFYKNMYIYCERYLPEIFTILPYPNEYK